MKLPLTDSISLPVTSKPSLADVDKFKAPKYTLKLTKKKTAVGIENKYETLSGRTETGTNRMNTKSSN